jgi:hypothetical protein
VSTEHRVKVGQYEFVRPVPNYGQRLDISCTGRPISTASADRNDAFGAMMAALNAARVVLAAVRRGAFMGDISTSSRIGKALELHDSLVGDREPPSAWCGAAVEPRANATADRDRAMFRAFMKMPTAETLEDLNDMRAEIDDASLGPADRAEVKRVYGQRKAWLETGSKS